MSIDLTDAHEILINEMEILEREYDQLHAAKKREGERLRKEIRELRLHLRRALDENSELQSLLAKSWVR